MLQRAGEMKAGCCVFCWITCHSLPRHFFSEQRSVWWCAQDFQAAHLRMSRFQGMVLWSVHVGGRRGSSTPGVCQVCCAHAAQPLVHSPGPPCHTCVPTDPQELHEEQRVPLQPAGPVWDPDASHVPPVHCEDDIWRLVPPEAARKTRDYQFWSVRCPHFEFFKISVHSSSFSFRYSFSLLEQVHPPGADQCPRASGVSIRRLLFKHCTFVWSEWLRRRPQCTRCPVQH